MRGTIPSLPNMPSWCGAQLKKQKHRDNLYCCMIEVDSYTDVHSLMQQHLDFGIPLSECSERVKVVDEIPKLSEHC